jgi:16S rRNA U1498 N3-methylase RsmE
VLSAHNNRAADGHADENTVYAHRLLFHPGYEGATATPVQQLHLPVHVDDGSSGSEKTRSSAAVLLAIGPEGGWVDFELGLFAEAGFECVHMGPRILRTDVALVGGVMLVRAALDRALATHDTQDAMPYS